MDKLHKILFSLVMVAGLSIAVSAQKNGPKRPPPPKDNPPVVTPNVKPPKNDGQDRGKPKPKKPSAEMIGYREQSEEELA